MADATTTAMIPSYTLVGGAENMKLLFDTMLGLQTQKVADDQASARAWANLNLYRATNAEVFSHAVNMFTVNAMQTGDTADTQTVSPIKTAAADNLAAGAVPANRTIDTAAAGIATGNVDIVAAMANVANAMASAISTLQTLAGAIAVTNVSGQPTTGTTKSA
jgi:hypothetical protein